MATHQRYAVLLDGGFVVKKLQQSHKRFPTPEDIERLCGAIAERPDFAGHQLLRNYFYHASPATGVLVNPLDNSTVDLSATKIHAQHESLIDRLEMKPNLRIGLDIARLALRDVVGAVVVVTGDSDLVPAFKFARREGVRVYLECLGHPVRRDLKAHADIVW